MSNVTRVECIASESRNRYEKYLMFEDTLDVRIE